MGTVVNTTFEPVRFRHRYTGKLETERIYGEPWLRWAYQTRAGRLSLWALATRPWFSRWYGWRMDRPASRDRVQPFIEQFGLDPVEFADAPESYRSFNEFFYRRLRPGCRPVCEDPGALVFPADGRHWGWPVMGVDDTLYVKGERLDWGQCLGSPERKSRYLGGTAVFSRLCPVDYHRFHFPVDGTPGEPERVEGRLASVNPVALRVSLAALWRNRRWITEITSPTAGRVLMIEIGATNVGSIRHTFTPGQPLAKGAEKGYFRFGGSAILTVFEPGRVRLAEDLVMAGREGLELYAHVGDRLGDLTRPGVLL
jgi:phosphatidylserine decarboxylase